MSEPRGSASPPLIHQSADVAPDASIGHGASIWHFAQVREGAEIGQDSIIGRGVYIGSGVRIGNFCKIQNYALVYEPAVLEDGVFVGPAVIFTNDNLPRAITPEGRLKTTSDWDQTGVRVRYGASVGARSVCVAPVTIGRWALVAAGSVVVRDVPDHALVAGVPARQLGWVSRSGRRLEWTAPGMWKCPESSDTYEEISTGLALRDDALAQFDSSRSHNA